MHENYEQFYRFPLYMQRNPYVGWSDIERQNLLQSVRKNMQSDGHVNWALVNEDFPTRTRQQCKSMYFNEIKPKLDKDTQPQQQAENAVQQEDEKELNQYGQFPENTINKQSSAKTISKKQLPIQNNSCSQVVNCNPDQDLIDYLQNILKPPTDIKQWNPYQLVTFYQIAHHFKCKWEIIRTYFPQYSDEEFAKLYFQTENMLEQLYFDMEQLQRPDFMNLSLDVGRVKFIYNNAAVIGFKIRRFYSELSVEEPKPVQLDAPCYLNVDVPNDYEGDIFLSLCDRIDFDQVAQNAADFLRAHGCVI